MNTNSAKIPNIRIVGGGVAGMILATRLGEKLGRQGHANISLIDKSPTHIWKPMLHTFAAGTWNIYQQQVQFVSHAHAHHFEYIPGELEGVDQGTRRIRLAPVQVAGEYVTEPQELDYDILILAYGSRANDFGNSGVAEHCHFIDDQMQADQFNQRLRVHAARDYSRRGDLNIAIVGGGATGVELAAELSRTAELASSYGDHTARKRLRLTLMEGASRILGAFPEEISTSATDQLRALGVEVRTNVNVVGADADGFLLEGGERVDASLKVWAAGIRASNVLDGSGLELNRVGQVVVEANLSAKGGTHIFALGDCSSLRVEGAERPLPSTAQVANQQAIHLIRHLPAFVKKGSEIPPFAFRDLGSLVSLSDYNAYGTLGRFGFFKGGMIKGRFAQISHSVLYRRHQFMLHGLPRALLLWLADRINSAAQPPIRMG